MLKQLFSGVKIHLRQSVLLLLVHVLNAVLLFVTNYFLVKLIGEKDYGHYVTLNTWATVLSIAAAIGMEDFFVAKLPKLKQHEGYNIFLWSIKITILASVATCIITEAFIRFGFINEIVAEYKLIFYAYIFLLAISMVFIGYLRAIGHISYSQLLNRIARPVLVLLLIGIFVLFSFTIDFENVLYIQMIAFAITIFICWYFIEKHFKQKINVSFDKSLKTNFTFLFISLIYLLGTRLDILFLTKYAVSAEEVGYYNMGARLSDLVGYPISVINIVIPTYISKQAGLLSKQQLIKTVGKISVLLFAVTLVAIIVLLSSGNFVLGLFGKNFTGAFWPTMILSCTYLFASFATPLNCILMVSDKQRISLVNLSVSLIAVTLCCIFLIPKYGMYGASLATLAGSITFLITTLFALKKID